MDETIRVKSEREGSLLLIHVRNAVSSGRIFGDGRGPLSLSGAYPECRTKPAIL